MTAKELIEELEQTLEDRDGEDIEVRMDVDFDGSYGIWDICVVPDYDDGDVLIMSSYEADEGRYATPGMDGTTEHAKAAVGTHQRLSWLSRVGIKPATNGRNDPASEFCARCCQKRGIFLSNKPDINEL